MIISKSYFQRRFDNSYDNIMYYCLYDFKCSYLTGSGCTNNPQKVFFFGLVKKRDWMPRD